MPIRLRDQSVYLGRAESTLENFAPNFDGTVVGAGLFTGAIARSLQPFSSAFVGQYQAISLKTGTIGTTLAGVTANFGFYTRGVWLTRAEIEALPASGTAFTRLTSAANASWGSADLNNLDSTHDTFTLAGALYTAKTNDQTILTKTRNALASLTSLTSTSVLPLARSLQAYIIAADLIGYRNASFLSWVTTIVDANIPGHSTANSLRQTAQRSANNWGGHSRAALAAAAVYLNNSSMLADVVQAQQEFIGTYSGGSPQMIFSTTSPDQDWHFNLSDKAGVNRADAGYLSGILPEEWRRDTGFTAPGTDLASLAGVASTYLWEGIHGFIVSAVILHREGSVPITSGSNAVQRAIDVLIATAHPALGDDRWIPWLANQYLGTNYDTSAGIQEGKGMGWTDWTGEAGTGNSGDNAARIDVHLDQYTLPFTLNYPADPITTQTINVPADMSLNDAVQQSGALINVAAGYTSTGTLGGWGNDVDIVMDNTASHNGGVDIASAARVRWTGGNINSSGSTLSTSLSTDVLFDNVNITLFTIAPGLNQNGFSRVAFINCTTRTTNYSFFTQNPFTSPANLNRWNFYDLLTANCDCEGGYPSGAEASHRWMAVNRGVIVDSRIWNGQKHTYRSHTGTANVYIRNNSFEAGNMPYTDPETNGATSTNPLNIIGSHWFIDNRMYEPDTGMQNVRRAQPSASDTDSVYIVTGNVAYNGSNTVPGGDGDWRFPTPFRSGDVTSGNTEYPYQAPPAFSGGADH